MLYIITALKPEAQAFVDKYKLKKMKLEGFTLFTNEKIILIVSGLGVVNAKKATNVIINNFNIKQDNIFLNIGICGANKDYKIGKLLQIGSIVYNDKIFIIKKEIKNTINCLNEEVFQDGYQIVDMESFGFYDALKQKVDTNNIYIFKVVSDYFEPYTVTKDATKVLIFKEIENIIKEIKK